MCGVPLESDLRPVTLKYAPGVAVGLIWRLLRDAMGHSVIARFGYCAQHRPWIMPGNARIVRWVCAVCTPLLLVVAVATLASGMRGLAIWSGITSGVSFLLSILMSFKETPIQAELVEGQHAWLSGFGEDYLAHFIPIEQARDQEAEAAAIDLNRVSG
jgi:hypothetical protein